METINFSKVRKEMLKDKFGVKWNFIVLSNNEYCTSYSFSADSDQMFEIYKIVKSLKDILIENITNENSAMQ
jgi:hypothetical protein